MDKLTVRLNILFCCKKLLGPIGSIDIVKH